MTRVVLLHSALGDSRLWRRQVDALSPRFEVVAPDLPGWGRTPLPTEPFSYVETVASYLPAALVGNSFGGMVAEWAFDDGDLERATQVNHDFWVRPEHHDEVRPQQRRAFELQSAHEEPEVRWPELSPLASLGIPALVVVGEDDKADFRAIALHLAEEIPHAELVTVPGAGHLVGLDAPDELNALLLEFLEH
ncbi:MAG TPA: alpha/beta fold hydrolase [Gaiellaceae bacterium]|nr:alpha/beta fold hydrolase [Gaiellaceae bacterium]